ncbi:hypothetical protein HanXRQr2_Chr14g0661851 [Helianthus annuus]|uniref:Uncharacterized protein n=1 Tax=Helianthus annuus TaxID=4232 RepID=A0A9K3ECH6_HELAN|nr:hypothetical protein HanXRQr2_Chr14g0661851 [Helianthus annuus]KAJ0841859.1 hypothetical protein HanPSC8_Chr14g0635121 [Helianthus annuus]
MVLNQPLTTIQGKDHLLGVNVRSLGRQKRHGVPLSRRVLRKG